MPSCEKPRDEPQTQTEAMRLTFGAAGDGVDNSVTAVNSRGHWPLAKDRFFGFLTYPMFLARFCVGAVSSPLSFNSSGIAEILEFLVFQSGLLLDRNNADRHEATNPEIMVSGLESGQSGRESVPGQDVVNRAVISAE